MKKTSSSSDIKEYVLIYFYISFPITFPLFLSHDWKDLPLQLIASGGFLLPFTIFPQFRKLFIAAYLPFYIIYLAEICHTAIFKSPLTQSSVLTALDSTSAEAKEFIIHFFRLPILITVSLYLTVSIILTIFLFRRRTKLKYHFFLTFFSAAAFLFSVYNGFHTTYFNKNQLLPYKFIQIIKIRQEQINKEKKQYTKYRLQTINGLKSNNPPYLPETYLIVIGESASRQHMQYYGAQRQTNPYSGKLITPFIFSNVQSPHALTVLSLKSILSMQTLSGKHISLLNIFRLSGFKVFWLSNQYYSGEDKELTNIYAFAADVQIFTNNVKDYLLVTEKNNYDKHLLPHLDNALQDKALKKVIFIHLAGSHAPYNRRFPPEFEVFGKNETNSFVKEVDDYDNSILYTDFLLSEMIKKISALPEQSFLLYFSDHGEDVQTTPKSCHCHSDVVQIQTPAMFEIPFLLWTNKTYNLANTNLIKNLSVIQSRPFNTRDLIHSLPSLAGISYNEQNAAKNLFANTYRP